MGGRATHVLKTGVYIIHLSGHTSITPFDKRALLHTSKFQSLVHLYFLSFHFSPVLKHSRITRMAKLAARCVNTSSCNFKGKYRTYLYK